MGSADMKGTRRPPALPFDALYDITMQRIDDLQSEADRERDYRRAAVDERSDDPQAA